MPDTTSTIPGTFKKLDQAAFNAALLVHGDYQFADPRWHVGATYVYANPLGLNGPCGYPAQYGSGGECSQYPPNNNYNQSDTTLPGFILSTFAEAYVRFKDRRSDVIAGDQFFSEPWAPPSDSRIKAAYYQGVDAQYGFGEHWHIGISRITQWESRTSSSFDKSNLILPLAADGSIAEPTTGFLLLQASYEYGARVSARAQYYAFYDISSLLWADAKLSWAPASPLDPSLSVQFGREWNSGTSLAGTINSTVLGWQLHAKFGKNVEANLGFDTQPWKSAVVTLPKGVSCKGHVISGSGPTGGTGYWLPTGGTPNCLPSAGSTATIYYGGIASPYTDSYSSSPLFTTAESQDMVERRSAGDSARLVVTLTTNDRRLRAIFTRAFDNFNNGAGNETTWGNDIEVEYDVAHGLSLIERWAQRTQSNTQLWGGTPLFNYNRVQLQYSF